MLQDRRELKPLSPNTANIYLPSELLSDAAFPLSPGDPYLLRTVRNEAVVVTPVDVVVETLDVPPVNEDLLVNGNGNGNGGAL